MTETASGALRHTERQIALINGDIEPETNEEWAYIQKHANDLLPKDPKRTELYNITGDDLDKSFHNDRGSTQAGHIGEALDDND